MSKTKYGLGAALALTLASAGVFSSAALAQQTDDPLQMKLSSFVPPVHFLTPILERFAHELTEASEPGYDRRHCGSTQRLGKRAATWVVHPPVKLDEAVTARRTRHE